MRSTLHSSLFALVALGAASSCAGPLPVENAETPARPSTPSVEAVTTQSAVASLAEPARKLAEYVVRYNATTHQMTFTPKDEEGATGGRPLRGYTQIASNTLTFATLTAVNGPAVWDGGSMCEADQTCARVEVTNDSARDIDIVRVEINNLVDATLVNGDALGTNYPSTAGNAGGFNYNSLPASGGTSSTPWIFSSTTDFTFTVIVWGAYQRTTYGASSGTLSDNSVAATGTWSDSAPAWRDACLIAGAQTGLSAQSTFNTAYFSPHFPFTLYDTTIDFDNWASSVEVSTAGTVSLLGISGETNFATGDASNTQDYSLLPFWDALQTTNGQVCAALDPTSSTPNRRFVITWKDANLTGTPNSRMTFSVVLRENNDQVFYLYNRWSASNTTCASSNATRGLGATIGIRGNGAAQSTAVSFNTAMLPVHAIPCPGPGHFRTFSATPVNP